MLFRSGSCLFPSHDRARLNSDGSLDPSFDTNNYLNGLPKQVLLQSDGKVILTGQFTTWNGATQKGIIRLTTTGTKDATFNIGTGFNWSTYGLIAQIQADGNILVYGDFTNYNGSAKRNLARLLPDGTLDNTLGIVTGKQIGRAHV